MASALPTHEISEEPSDKDPETMTAANEQMPRSTANPHLVSTTTGGVENSCHSCLLAFGMVTFLIGVSTTCLAIATEKTYSVLSILGISILVMGIASVTFSCIWRVYRRKRKEKRNEDRAALVYEYQEKKLTI
ncbi:hypothetical protein FKM82_013471 [Ascaphus truei]